MIRILEHSFEKHNLNAKQLPWVRKKFEGLVSGKNRRHLVNLSHDGGVQIQVSENYCNALEIQNIVKAINDAIEEYLSDEGTYTPEPKDE